MHDCLNLIKVLVLCEKGLKKRFLLKNQKIIIKSKKIRRFM